MFSLLLPTMLLLSPSLSSSLSPPYVSQDYGKIIFNSPIQVLHPKTPKDISLFVTTIFSSTHQNSITVAARGAGHSTYGQATAPGGFVIDMRSLPCSIHVGKAIDGTDYVDAGGEALWVDVLKETLKHGLTPRSWTDYLYLTVGGTLSVGGISGQAFKYGPQISNVLELDVITGKGEHVTCSCEENSDLFFAVLGGLGQFGIITRARIILEPAHRMVKWVRIRYDEFSPFTRAQELLISTGEVDYVEGFVKLEDESNSGQSSNGLPTRFSVNSEAGLRGSNVHYLLEMALYGDDESCTKKILDGILLQLKVDLSRVSIYNVSYFDFLNRVRRDEEDLTKKGLWDVPHPWLNLFVPRAHIARFKDLLLETISDNYNAGPIILYPTMTQKWKSQTSMVLPEDDACSGIMYVASILRAAPPSCTSGTPCLDNLLHQNQKMISIAIAEPNSSSMGGGMGAKQYLPYWHNQMEWMAHFGAKWERFSEVKTRFDPLNILTPGQRIFKRKAIVEGATD